MPTISPRPTISPEPSPAPTPRPSPAPTTAAQACGSECCAGFTLASQTFTRLAPSETGSCCWSACAYRNSDDTQHVFKWSSDGGSTITWYRAVEAPCSTTSISYYAS